MNYVPRFEFVLENGMPIVGPVRGAGGMVQTAERMTIACDRALRGRATGLYEPIVGHCAVFPDYEAKGDGEPKIVSLARYRGLARWYVEVRGSNGALLGRTWFVSREAAAGYAGRCVANGLRVFEIDAGAAEAARKRGVVRVR